MDAPDRHNRQMYASLNQFVSQMEFDSNAVGRPCSDCDCHCISCYVITGIGFFSCAG